MANYEIIGAGQDTARPAPKKEEKQMTIEEAEEIFMAHQVGANYPSHLITEAVLILQGNDPE